MYVIERDWKSLKIFKKNVWFCCLHKFSIYNENPISGITFYNVIVVKFISQFLLKYLKCLVACFDDLIADYRISL